jgi:tetratricopeptide (TPR) repeat protein
MIASSSAQLTNFEEFSVDPTIRMEPPVNDPFVAAPALSLTGQLNDFRFSLDEVVAPENRLTDADKILEMMVSSATRDIDRYPKSARAYLNLGIALLNKGRTDEAAEAFEAALRLDGKNYPAAISLARIRVLHAQYDEARAAYENLSREHLASPAILTSLAYVCMQHGKYDEAETLLRRVVRLDEGAAVPRYHLGVVFLKVGKPRDAIAQLRAASRFDVRSPAIHHALGVAYVAQGDFKRAVNALKAALVLAPGMIESVHALAEIYLRSADPNRTIQLLSAYLSKYGSEDMVAREMLAQAYETLQRYGDARSQLLELLDLLKGEDLSSQRQRSLLMNNVGVLFARENMLDRASDWIGRAIKLCPDADAILYNNQARVCLSQRKPAEALQFLSAAKMYFPSNYETDLLFALALHKQGRNDDAIVELRRLLLTGAADCEAYSNLGWILADEKRDMDAALEVLEEGHRRFGGDRMLSNNLAYVRLMRGEVSAARRVLESTPIGGKAVEMATLTATWGLLRIREGAIDEGIALYKEAETIANRDGQTEHGRIVRQKMYLELARAYIRAGNVEAAREEVVRGLKIRDARSCYTEDLESLNASFQP